jgi:hypothetical protein
VTSPLGIQHAASVNLCPSPQCKEIDEKELIQWVLQWIYARLTIDVRTLEQNFPFCKTPIKVSDFIGKGT